MELSDQLEGMSSKEQEKFLTKLWKKKDWALSVTQMLWGMDIPQCPCDFHDHIYRIHLEAGRELYKDNPEAYERIVAVENARRKERKLSRELDRQKYARSSLKRALVFN